MADFSMKANDRLPSIQATLGLTSGPLDVTDADSVDFIMRRIVSRDADGEPVLEVAPTVNAPAVVVDETTVRYDWLDGDTATPGSYLAEWEVHWTATKSQTFPTDSYHEVEVVPDLDEEA